MVACVVSALNIHFSAMRGCGLQRTLHCSSLSWRAAPEAEMICPDPAGAYAEGAPGQPGCLSTSAD